MILSTIITPMNCAFGTGLNSLATFYETEFNSATDRKVLFYNPIESKFSMYSKTAEAYIEPCIYGTKGGDKVTISFKARKKAGGNTQVKCWLGEILDDYSTTYSDSTSFQVDINDFHYNEYKFDIICTNINANKIGNIFVIRTAIGGKIDIKDIKLTIDTCNPNLKLNNNLFIINNKTDFETIINQQAKSTAYDMSNTKNELISGTVKIENDILVAKSTTIGFKGLSIKVEDKKFVNSVIPVYVEYKKQDAETRVSVTYKYNNTNNTDLILLDDKTDFFKKILYLKIIQKTAEKIYIEVGAPRTVNYSIKELIINDQRFSDDLDKTLYLRTNTDLFLTN